MCLKLDVALKSVLGQKLPKNISNFMTRQCFRPLSWSVSKQWTQMSCIGFFSGEISQWHTTEQNMSLCHESSENSSKLCQSYLLVLTEQSRLYFHFHWGYLCDLLKGFSLCWPFHQAVNGSGLEKSPWGKIKHFLQKYILSLIIWEFIKWIFWSCLK